MKAVQEGKSRWMVFSLSVMLAPVILLAFFLLMAKGTAGRGETERLNRALMKPKIVIHKSERRLYLYSDSKIVRSYQIGLGFQPIGHKVREGDGRTPEGEYYICTKNPRSRYYLSLGLSYPNAQDAERGLREGSIRREQYKKIVEAISNGATPPWDTPLGGEIFIHGHGSKRDWTHGCIALDDKDIQELYDLVAVGTGVSIEAGGAGPAENDAFAGAAKHSRATIEIQSSVSGEPWSKSTAIYPLKEQKVVLKVDEVAGANIRWFQIVPDTTKIYKNANLPWEKNPYQWVGFAKITYQRVELTHFSGLWEMQLFAKEEGGKVRVEKSKPSSPLQRRVIDSRFYHEDVGSFWFQAEVAKASTIYRSAGLEDSDKRGLSPQVLRVSIRDGEGYVGYLTSFFNVPGLFGSVTYQSNNYIGADCADVLMAAYGKWRNEPVKKNYNVAMLVSQWRKVEEFDLLEGTANKKLNWGRDIRPGDFIAVRYRGSRQYQHIGALYSDANRNSILDGGDVVIHAGPQALHYSHLEEGNFDGHTVVLRP